MSECLIPILANWEVTTLGEVCRRGGGGIQTGPFGSQLHAADYVPFGIPAIMPQNIGDNRINEEGIARITPDDAQRLSRYLVREGDIVYSRRGDVERRALVRQHEDGWLCGTGCLRVSFGKGVVHPSYAAFYLGHPSVREWIVRHAHGATMPNLNTSILSALPFVLPPLEEQRDIARILGDLDDKIELNRQINQTLEQMAQAIFKSWFVDFEPVRIRRGESCFRPPLDSSNAGDHKDRPYLAAEILALFPDELVDSELGEIPKGWEVKPFSDTVQIIGGGTPKTSVAQNWDGDIPWFSVVDAPADHDVFVIDTVKKITLAGLESSSTRLLSEGTTIISARGTVGKLALTAVPMSMNQSCYGLSGIDGSVYFTYFSTRRLVSTLKQHSHGSVFDTITRDTLSGVDVVLPSKDVLNAFENSVLPLMQNIRKNLEQSRTLATLRDTLLPKLLSGELAVTPTEEVAA